MKKNKIINIVQLPIIEERLHQIKEDAIKKIDNALGLECTEETVKSIKVLRAELNKDFKEWEDKRKDVKNQVLKPYEAFEGVYDDCIKNVYKDGILKLDERVDAVEGGLKAQKRKDVNEYFDEYLCAAEIKTGVALFEWVTFEKSNINITLSASLKSLKEQTKVFIDKIVNELSIIEMQEHKEEILYEYKNTLDVSSSIKAVLGRHKAINEMSVIDNSAIPEETTHTHNEPDEPLQAPIVVECEKTYTMRFAIKGTKEQLKEIKQAIIDCGAEILGGNDNE